jgi:hypothetical protein
MVCLPGEYVGIVRFAADLVGAQVYLNGILSGFLLESQAGGIRYIRKHCVLPTLVITGNRKAFKSESVTNFRELWLDCDNPVP